MINALLAMEAFQGIRWTIQRTDYSWQTKKEYIVRFSFDHNGDEIVVTRTGEDLEKIFNEAHATFNERLGKAFKPFELYPTAIESRVVNAD
jgi:hypothetical protein